MQTFQRPIKNKEGKVVDTEIYTRDELVDGAITSRLANKVITPTEDPNIFIGPDKKEYTREELGEGAIVARLAEGVIRDISGQQALVGGIRGSGLQGAIRPIQQLASTILPSSVKPGYSQDAALRAAEISSDVSDVAGLVAAPLSAIPGAVGGAVLAGTGLDQPIGKALTAVEELAMKPIENKIEDLKDYATIARTNLSDAIRTKDFNKVKQYARDYKNAMKAVGDMEQQAAGAELITETAIEAAPSVVGAVPMVKGVSTRAGVPDTSAVVEATRKGVPTDIIRKAVDVQTGTLQKQLESVGANIPRGSTIRPTTESISGEFVYPARKMGAPDVPVTAGRGGVYVPTASIGDFLKKLDVDIKKFKGDTFDKIDIDNMLNDLGELKVTTLKVISENPNLRTATLTSGIESIANAEKTLKWLKDAKVAPALKANILKDLANSMSKNIFKPVTDALTESSAKTSLLSGTPILGKSTNLERAALVAGLKLPRELMTEDRYLEELIANLDKPKK